MSYILRAIYEMPWAILPAKLSELISVAQRHAAGERLSAEEVAAIKAAARKADARAAGSVAVLQLYGSIFPHANLMTEMSGAVSAERFKAVFNAAMADPAVTSIVIDIDSPGGAVSGVPELADVIFNARGQKPIVAVADHLAASAAYWIGTAADELLVTPSGEVGSIGVFAAHEDWSRAYDNAGVTVNLISAGKFKTEGNPYQPLGEEARAAIQARVDEYYDMFVKAVARNRGVKVSDVRGGFGEGRVVGAREAVASGMADRVGTLDDAINRAARGRVNTSARADLEMRQRRLRFAGKV